MVLALETLQVALLALWVGGGSLCGGDEADAGDCGRGDTKALGLAGASEECAEHGLIECGVMEEWIKEAKEWGCGLNK